MKPTVLVHGAAHGGWCWEKLVPLLNKNGGSLATPDLPGHGSDTTPINVVTMDRYVDAVCGVVMGMEGKVVLAGHSLGGAVISLVAESMPEKIDRLIYISGFTGVSGMSVGQLLDEDTESQLADAFTLSEDQSQLTLKPDKAGEVVYNGCTPEDVSWACGKLSVQSVNPLFQTMEVTPERYGTVPKHAILCADDRALTPAMQQKMYSFVSCGTVEQLPTGHAPFLAQPRALADAIAKLSVI
jgi:pimeloyl-ACP methyl ester carboxylesterase